MSNQFLFDGFNYASPVQHGPILISVDAINRARTWRQTMMQRAENWLPLPLDTGGPALGSLLVNETEPSDAGCGVVKWIREFAEVPDPHTGASGYSMSYQYLVNGELAEIPIGTTATIQYDYHHAPDPSGIPTIRAHRVAKLGNILVYTGTGSLVASVYPAADSQIDRWKGNIWVRSTPYVPNHTIAQLLTDT